MSPLIPYFTPIEIGLSLSTDHSLSISGFGIFFGLGLILGNLVSYRRARTCGLSAEDAWNGIAVVNVATIFGASLAYNLIYAPALARSDWTEILDFRSGLSSIGGIVFSIAGCLLLYRKDRSKFWRFGDSVASGFLIGFPIARLGCVLNHEHLAAPSNFILARYCRPVDGHSLVWPSWMTPDIFDYRFGACLLGEPPVFHASHAVGEEFVGIKAVHDLAIYEIAYIVVIIILAKLYFRQRSTGPGQFLAFVGVTYAIGRFVIEFLRPELTNPRYAGLTGVQWGLVLSLGLIMVCGPVYQRLVRILTLRARGL